LQSTQRPYSGLLRIKNKVMKNIICLSLFLLCNALSICSGQVRDSVCVHNFTSNYWQSICPIDSAGYSNCISNSPYFKTSFQNDSLFIELKENSCLPKTIFICEYTTRDSIHFIHFLKIAKPWLRACLEGICGTTISKDQLPELRRMTLCTNIDSINIKMKITGYSLYVQHDTSFPVFKVTGTEIPKEALNLIMSLKENQSITIDDIRVLGPDGNRVIDGVSYLIKN
jgi:hypothetical protein